MTSIPQNQCCERRTYIVLDNPRQYLCRLHIDADSQARLAVLDAQAESVGVRQGNWPYGPNTHLAAREAMVAWARAEDVQLSSWRGSGCIHWLLTGRCLDYNCRYVINNGFGDLRPSGIDLGGDWMDHVTTWTRDGAPAALVSQPYGLSEKDRDALMLLGTKPGLRVEINDAGGWYGGRTYWIAIWREGDVVLTDPKPQCVDCGRTRATWVLHKPTLAWHCHGCFLKHMQANGVGWDDVEGNILEGTRADLIRWMRWATFLHDATGGELQ